MAGVHKTHFNVLYGKLLKCVAKTASSCPINVVALRQGLPSVHFVDQDAAKKYMEKYHDSTRRYMTKESYRRNRRHRPDLKTTNDALAAYGLSAADTGFTDRDVQFATARCDEPLTLDVESIDGAPLSTFDPERAAKQHIAAMASAANRDNKYQLQKLKHAEMLPGTTVVNKRTGEVVDAGEVVDTAMLRIHEEKNREHAQNVLNTLAAYKEFPNDWSDKFTSLDGTVTVSAKVVPDQFHDDAYASMSEEMRAACEVEEATIDYDKLDKLIEERPELRDLVYTGANCMNVSSHDGGTRPRTLLPLLTVGPCTRTTHPTHTLPAVQSQRARTRLQGPRAASSDGTPPGRACAPPSTAPRTLPHLLRR